MAIDIIAGQDEKSIEKRDALGMQYLGLSLALAWFYCMWFSPSVFVAAPLMGRSMIYSWVATLGFSALAFLTIPLALRKIKIAEHRWIVHISSGALFICTLLFTLCDPIAGSPLMIWIVLPIIFAICNALIWAAWGEFHAFKRSTFTLQKFALVYGIVMFVCMTITELLPAPLCNMFIALIPIASTAVYFEEMRALEQKKAPALLPKAIRVKTNRATFIMSAALCLACAACYYTVAIIPESDIALGDMSYPSGMAFAAIICIIIALGAKLSKRKSAAFSLLPYFMVVTVVAIALYANNNSFLYTASFVLCVILAGLFEIFMISYFGTMSTKGYMKPVLAFCASSAVVRLGFFIGETWAVVYEEFPTACNPYCATTALGFICVVAISLIPLLHRETEILQLMQPAAPSTDFEDICDAIIVEFKLSKREGEILRLIAKGFTVDNISKKLVISPYTTQTHVRHIYAKMDVHKRSELLDYINMHRDSDEATPPPRHK